MGWRWRLEQAAALLIVLAVVAVLGLIVVAMVDSAPKEGAPTPLTGSEHNRSCLELPDYCEPPEREPWP